MFLKEKKYYYLILTLFLLYAIIDFYFGEKIQQGFGFGWDGVIYGFWSTDLQKNLFETPISNYSINRILPSIIVGVLNKLLCLKSQFVEIGNLKLDKNVINLFHFYNIFILTLSILFWRKIVIKYINNKSVYFLSYILLFVNYFFLRYFFFYPVSTDQTAFLLSILAIYSFEKKSKLSLILIAIIGSFTWPTSSMVCLILLIKDEDLSFVFTKLLTFKIVKYIPYIIIISTVYFGVRNNYILPYNSVQINNDLIIISILFGLGLIYIINKYLLIENNIFSIFSKEQNSFNVLFILLLLIFIKFINYYFSSNDGIGIKLNFFQFIYESILAGLSRPGVFIIAHTVFFGSSLFYIIWFWEGFVKTLDNKANIKFIIILGLFMSINPESRQLIFFYPFFVYILISSISNLKINLSLILYTLIINLFSTKFWLKFTGVINDDTDFYSFPLQNFMLSNGPWMSNKNLIIQSLIIFILSFPFYFLIKTTVFYNKPE